MHPLISVIIPTYNCAQTITVAIQSMVGQTYPNLEIIIVDDNSTDNTKEVVSKFIKENKNVSYYYLPYNDRRRFNIHGKNVNAGWMARNYGIKKAKGKWITFQDADDASLINRIEVQYQMAKKYNSYHVCVDWKKFNPKFLDKSLAVKKIMKEKFTIIPTQEILQLIDKTKGSIFSILGKKHKYIPFIIKKRRLLKFLFFKSWEPFPGCGSAPLIKKEVVKKVKFLPLPERVWPSERGRGADRDFNFQVAETFKNSIVVKLPLYLWRQSKQNPAYNNRRYRPE